VTRHRLDPFALSVGVLFGAVAVGFFFDGLDRWSADATWVVPIVLIGLGLAGVLSTVLRAREHEHREVEP
jgi:hypothetical protein